MTSALRVRAHGKLNLFLRILGARPDGYHEIETIFQTISLFDELGFTLDASGRVELEQAEGSTAPLPPAEHNLIVRAAECLYPYRDSEAGARIRVRKGIPVGGGLAGGSADAAATLVVLNELWDCSLPDAELARLAGGLGSDVPYLIGGGTVLATARGEQLAPLGSLSELWFVLGISHRPLLTGDVYAAWDRLEPVAPAVSAPLTLALTGGDPAEVARLVHNDLEPAAFLLRPELVAGKVLMLEAGALGACVSGSGPTIFAVARDEGHARELARSVEGGFDRVEVAVSRPRSMEVIEEDPPEGGVTNGPVDR